jgi:hypothetical protein
MATTLYELLPRGADVSSDTLLGKFLDYVAARRLTLYPAQEEAILELFEDKHVILNTPTARENHWWRWRCISRRWRGEGARFTPARSRRLVNEKWLDALPRVRAGQRRPEPPATPR